MDLATVLGILGLVVGVPALIMAVPPFAQVVGGRPKIRLAFHESTEQGSKILICAIHNLRVQHRLLKLLGVIRSETQVAASFDICEHGTRKIIASDFRARLIDSFSHELGLRLTVRPPLPICFPVVDHDEKGAISTNRAPTEERTLALVPGEYFADIKIAWGEDHGARVRKSFSVGTTKDATYWTNRRLD